jgi:hypothetical protein
MSTESNPVDAAGMDRTGYALLKTFEQPGCVVCTFTNATMLRYFDSIGYESVTDLDVRLKLEASFGYCAPHAQQWLSLGNAQGTAIIYVNLCEKVRKALDAQSGAGGGGGFRGRLQNLLGGGAGGTDAGRALAQALEPEVPCPACRYSRDTEAGAITSCATAFVYEPFLAAFAAHPVGLCLPHFRAVLRQIGDPVLLRRVLEAQSARLAGTTADLREVIRKFDYRFHSEPHGPEFEAPARSIEQIAGHLPTLLNPPKPGG